MSTNGQPNRRQQIRDLFEELGGLVPTHQLAEACIERGIFGYDDLRRLHLTAVQSECRKALKETDAVGLPFAGPAAMGDVTGEAAPWIQRKLWSYDEYESNIADRVKGEIADHGVIVRLRDECLERYERAPKIPELVIS